MGRHEFDAASFLAGLLFVGVGAAYLLTGVLDVRIDARWVLPVSLVVLGLAGLAGSWGRGRGAPPGDPADPPPEPAASPEPAQQEQD